MQINHFTGTDTIYILSLQLISQICLLYVMIMKIKLVSPLVFLCTFYCIFTLNFLYAQPTTIGLVAYYPFTGNAGDSSGIGNHGTIYNATLATNRFGNPNSAYYFNGTNSYISVPATSSIQPSSALTLCAWISTEWKTSGWSPIVTKRFTANSDPWNSYTLNTYISMNKKWTIGLSNGNIGGLNYYYAKDTLNYNTNTWGHLAATYDGTVVKIYLNGNLDTSYATSTSYIGYSSLPLYLGWSGNGASEYYKGKIDDVRIYNRALTASEIMTIYNPNYNPFQNTYYSKSIGKLDSLTTWGTNTDGTGTMPLNFNANNTAYIVKNNSSPTISNNWFVTGSNTAIIIGDGNSSISTNIPSGLYIGADSIIVKNNSTLTVNGNLYVNKYFFDNGSTAQYFSGSAQSLPAASFYTLVIFGSNKTLSGNTTVRSNLVLLSSVICNGNTLTLGSGPTQRGTLNGSGTIWGRFTKWFAPTTVSGDTGLFPINTTNGIYRPLKIEFTASPSSGGTLSAEFISSPPGNSFPSTPYFDFTLSPPVPLNKTSPNGYWKLISANGLSGGTYTITTTATGFYGINSLDSLRLVYRSNSSSTWATNTAGVSVAGTGTLSAPIVKRSGVQNSGGEYTLASDSSKNALPVKLLSFEAKKIPGNKVLLFWQTAWEQNCSHFEVEKNEDISNNQIWKQLGKVNGKGNTNQMHNYQFTDNNMLPIKGDNSSVYYRIRQIDFDGRFEYSPILTINPEEKTADIIIFPNPAKTEVFVLSSKEISSIELLDLNGKCIIKVSKSNRLAIENIESGIYILKICQGEEIILKKVIKE